MIKIIIGVALLASGLWFATKFMRSTPEVQAAADLIKQDDPNISNEEATAQGAADVNATYLAQLRAQEEEARIAEQAAIVKALEYELAQKQEAALLAATAEAKKQAEAEALAAERQAAKERVELERRWTLDLDAAVNIMNRMKLAAESTITAVTSAQNKVLSWESKKDKAALGMKLTSTALNSYNLTVQAMSWWELSTNKDAIAARREFFVNQFNSYKTSYDIAVREQAKANIVLNSTRISANAALRDAQDATGDVLGLTRDLQNLGILLGLATRTDIIARATRTALNSLEAKL